MDDNSDPHRTGRRLLEQLQPLADKGFVSPPKPGNIATGRAMLLASPRATGSRDEFMTTGILAVTARTANAAAGDPATMTAGLSATNSATSSARRSIAPSAYRISSVMLRPSL
jgi:hypothetical protein